MKCFGQKLFDIRKPAALLIAFAMLISVFGGLSAKVEGATEIKINPSGAAASSAESDRVAANAIDNNTSTRWQSISNDNQWIFVDLGKSYNVTRVELMWEASYATSYNIDVSTNSSAWTTVSSVNSDGGTDATSFSSVAARYVRISATGRSDGKNGVSLYEISVFGSEIATGNYLSVVSANASSQDSANTAAKAVDGDSSTRWTSSVSDPNWILLDLGSNYSVSGANIVWEANFARSYSIELSTDCVNWATAYTATNGDGGTDDIKFTAGCARFVRINCFTRNDTKYGVSIYEIGITGSSVKYSTINPVAAVASSDEKNNPASNAVDGDGNSRWIANSEDNQWIYVDLGKVYSISNVQIDWEASYATAYHIDVSSDAATWWTVTNQSSDGGNDTVGLSGQTARYIRMYSTARSDNKYGISIYEFKAYGSYAGTSPAHIMDDTSFNCTLGDMIDLTAVNSAYSNVCDNRGMSGLDSSVHMHAAFSSSSQSGYVSENMYAFDSASDFVFDCGRIYPLGGLFIWNYNDKDNLNSGLKDVTISYSTDNAIWKTLGSFTLAQCSASENAAYGGNTATNTTFGNHAITFDGAAGRYIKISPKTNYGGSKFGLSEVRVFQMKQVPESGDMIYAEAYTTDNDGNDCPENVVNNTGMNLTDVKVGDGDKASNNTSDMWLSSGTAAQSLIAFNLGGTYPINCVKIWNYNGENLNYGIRNFDVYYTTSEPVSTTRIDTAQYANYQAVINAGVRDKISFSGGSWTKLGSYTLPKGSGSSMDASLTINFGGVHAQHVKIVPTSNYAGTANNFGLSEVRFFASNGWAVENSSTWTGMLSSSGSFKYQGNDSADPFGSWNQGGGWLGGDGIMSVNLQGAKYQNNGSISDSSGTLFTFQDSFIGNMGNYRSFSYEKGYADGTGTSIGMKNMTYMMLRGDAPDPRNLQFYHTLNNGLSNDNHLGNVLPSWYSVSGSDDTRSSTPTAYTHGYWISYSVVINNAIYTLAGRVGNNGWGNGVTDLYRQSISDNSADMNSEPTVALYGEQTASALYHQDGAGNTYTFGTTYTGANDGYVYLYGNYHPVTGWYSFDDRMIVMRFTEANYPTMSNPEYWSGSTWVSDISRCATISDFVAQGESGVTYMESGPYAGKYVIPYTQYSFGTIYGQMCIGVSDNLTGPFTAPSDGSNIYWATERYEISMDDYSGNPFVYELWNYNGKGHPAISGNDELLMTYHYGIHDGRTYSNGSSIVPPYGYFGFITKECEHPTFIRLFEIA